MHRSRQSLGALALASALGLAGCGGGSNDAAEPAAPSTSISTPTTAAEETATEETATESSEESGGSKVSIEGLAYQPVELSVAAGTEVVWTNQDQAQHTVTSNEGAALGSKLLDRGDTYRITLSDSGTYSYFCKVHPFMKATVIVEPS